MTFLLIVLLLIIVCLATALFFCVKRALFLADMLEDLGSNIEQSLDVIDDCYARISRIFKMPVLYDDPAVKQLLIDIKHVKNAVLLIANKLVAFEEKENEKN